MYELRQEIEPIVPTRAVVPTQTVFELSQKHNRSVI